MKVSYQWLSEYVDLTGYSGAELAEKFTRGGIEVDIVENRNKGVQGTVVGHVKERAKHPDADKLSVCTVDVGGPELLQIVCGAPNVAAGQKVPVAVVGAELPGGFKIKRAKLRGVESQGMICSAKELGMNDKLLPKDQQEGILVLPENTEIGSDILSVLGLADEVLELDLTPNRSDCLSMIGAAYEVGALLGREVKLPGSNLDSHQATEHVDSHFKVNIEAADHCKHYTARLIEGVKVGRSPLWLQNRLIAAGIRPINNVVDVTNYVMLEYGQPLHAFDADLLEGGRIEVRLARGGEKLTTLDDAERTLEPHMLVIADGVKAVALAGVMGGANSEVSENTTRILLESARFAGSTVRKTSRQLGLRSESSLRFEKEVNPDDVIPALNRASELIAQLTGGRIAEGIAEHIAETAEAREITLSLERMNGYLGTELSTLECKVILARLGFETAETADRTLTVKAPLRRGDLVREVDLIEEVARLYGYDNIPTTLMSGETSPGSLTRDQRIRRLIRTRMTGAGLHEAVTYSFTHPESITRFPGLYPDAKPIKLAMPMSEERSVLRTSIVPHLIEAAAYNRNRNEYDMAVFEIGSVFITEEESITRLPEERWLLAGLMTGSRIDAHWSGKSRAVDFYDAKGVLESLFSYLDISGISYVRGEAAGFHPGRTARIVLGDREIGVIGQLHPDLQRESDLEDTYVWELELKAVYEKADDGIAYRALPKYPSMSRDAALIVDRSVAAGEMLARARTAAGELLEGIEIFDVYEGDRVAPDKKSVALSFVYRNPDRTLTDEEVVEVHERVVAELEQTFGAELRK